MAFSLLIHGQKQTFRRPLIMGILNITPDSFSEKGKFFDPQKAGHRAIEMLEEGADIIDIGGESSGPGSVDVSEKEQLRRIIPVLKKLHNFRKKNPRRKFLISIDTYKYKVAEKALKSGADMINDITALRAINSQKMAALIARKKIPVILMYSKDSTPRTTRQNLHYKDLVKTISDFLKKRLEFAYSHGIKKSQIIIDPGMGAFVSGIGKYSFEILRRLPEFEKLDFPIIIGTSRKGFLGEALKELSENKKALPAAERLEATIASSLIALQNGANIIRVHDVKAIKRALIIWKKCQKFKSKG